MKTLTPEEMDAAGAKLAEALELKKDREHKDRWRTGWGTKTNTGLYLTLREMIRRIDNKEAL
jgi:hypothetical protein